MTTIQFSNFVPTLNQQSVNTFTNQLNIIQNGTYTVTSNSANYGVTFNNYQAFAYSPTNPNYWGTNMDNSITTQVDSNTISGCWLQIQLPTAVQMLTFTTYAVFNSPKSIVIAGSNDGATWNNITTINDTGLINTNVGGGWVDTTTASATFATNTNKNFYSYIRFIVTASNGGQCCLGKVNFSCNVISPYYSLLSNNVSNNVGMTVPIPFKSYLTDVTRSWYGVASNGDGTVLAACVYGGTYGYIYTSTDSGLNWTPRMTDLSRNWRCITSSGDGSKMVAAVYAGQIYTSTDYGSTWTARNSNRLWSSLASSYDVNLVATTSTQQFLPKSIPNLQLWLDAKDSSTLTLSGSSVTTWNDKSGYGNNATPYMDVNGSATYNSTGFNNLPAVQINSGGFVALSPIGIFTYNGITFFVIFQKTGSANGNGEALITKTNGGIASPFDMWSNARFVANDSWFQGGIGSGANGTALNIASATTITLYSSTINSTNWYEYINGGTSTLNPTYSFIYTPVNPVNFKDNVGNIYIGTRASKETKFTGVISEVIVYNRVLTTTERQSIEGYLAKKWNLSASLPINHPYYSNNPTATDGYIYTSNDSGQTWEVKKSDTNRIWSSVVSSSNGVNLAACAVNDNIYISNDSGTNWSPRMIDLSRNWSSIASSSNGTKLVAGVNGGYLYTSTNSGANWTARMTDLSRNWYELSSSSDGNIISACIYGGGLYTSTDSGVNWIARDSYRNWSSISCSSDATTLVACENGGYVYTLLADDTTYSQDIGTIIKSYISDTQPSVGIVSTIPQITSSILNWTFIYRPSGLRCIACSRTGKTVVSTSNGNSLYISTDSGLNWSARLTGNRGWQNEGVAVSSDGTKIVAADRIVQDICTSTDSGITWSFANIKREWNVVRCSKKMNVIIACSMSSDYIYTSINSGKTFTATMSDAIRNWTNVDISSDGTKMFASNGTGYIYISTDTGVTWTPRFQNNANNNIRTSSDGTKLLACVTNGYLYTSTDSGLTWTTRMSDATRVWRFLDSSSDGTKLVATVQPGYIYTSTDSGVNWIAQTSLGQFNWSGVSLTKDGNTIYAAYVDGSVYKSTILTSNTTLDIGKVYQSYVSGTQRTQNITVPKTNITGFTSWSTILPTIANQKLPSSVACSSDGTKVVACVYNEYIYTSTNGGSNWASLTSLGVKNWQSIASSSDGFKLVAVVNGGYVYTSTNSGATWTERVSAGVLNWYMVKSSNDGNNLYAITNTSNSGYIYTSTDSGANWKQQTTGISGAQDFRSIASSGDGKMLIAAPNKASLGGDIFVSTNSGNNWSTVNVGLANISTVASSYDGRILIAASSVANYIYMSSDFGTTWAAKTSSGNSLIWTNIAASYNCNIIIASQGNTTTTKGVTYSSIDYGNSWITNPITNNSVYWNSLAATSIGNKIFGAINDSIINITYIGLTQQTGVSTTTYGSYTLYSFLSTGVGTIKFNIDVSGATLIVGGGGSGGHGGASATGGSGGGGADVVINNYNYIKNTQYTITVGSGGISGNGSATINGSDGNNSTITGGVINGTASGGKIGSLGGGIGGASGSGNLGGTNGSGGGGGGGGAGAIGSSSTTSKGGNGGSGVQWVINGSTYGTYGGGGGGGGSTDINSATGGSGGGGNGGALDIGTVSGYHGTPNTGGGGGGGIAGNTNRYSRGGSGIVIIAVLTNSSETTITNVGKLSSLSGTTTKTYSDIGTTLQQI